MIDAIKHAAALWWFYLTAEGNSVTSDFVAIGTGVAGVAFCFLIAWPFLRRARQ